MTKSTRHGREQALGVPTSLDTDVLIIGAGPTGLTLAIELARHGVQVRLVDKRVGPVTRGKAEIVYPRTLEVLGAMGSAPAWLKHGYRIQELSFHALGQHLETVTLSNAYSDPRGSPLGISQDATERLLVEHLGALGVDVERLVEAVEVWQDDAGACARLRLPGGWTEIVRAGWVVGCEGSDSLVRTAHGIPFEGDQQFSLEFLQADVRVRWGHPSGIGHVFAEQDRLVGFLPYDADGLYRVFCARPGRASDGVPDPTLAEMQSIVREVADPGAMLSEPLWLSRHYTRGRIAQRFREGQAFLAGDAAHTQILLAGTGMNAGMQDAFELGWKLAYVVKGWSRSELLDTYDVERRCVTQQLIRLGNRGFQALTASNGTARSILRALGATAGSGLVQHHLHAAKEAEAYYRNGLLSEDHVGAGVCAGDPAPDMPAVLAEGRVQGQLHQHLSGQRWTLLVFGGVGGSGGRGSGSNALVGQVVAAFGQKVAIVRIEAGLDAASRLGEKAPVLLDIDGAIHNRYGARAEAQLVLVRPDLRVGFRAHAHAGGDALLAYLDRWLTQDNTGRKSKPFPNGILAEHS